MNKLLFSFFCLFFFVSFSFSMEADPFVSFPGEKVSLKFDSDVSLEMEYYYNLNETEKCRNSTCPLFGNNSLKEKGKNFILNTRNAKPGFYAIKVMEDDSEEFYYTSVAVRPDYRLLIGLALVVLVALVVAVEKNVFRKQ